MQALKHLFPYSVETEILKAELKSALFSVLASHSAYRSINCITQNLQEQEG
jgi:hypothetical protein